MLKSPANHLIVQLEKAFQDEIITPSGIKLYKDTHFSPEWNTTSTATVVASPQKLTKRDDLKGLEVKTEVGDEVIISYMVVFDMDLVDRDTPIHYNLFYHEGEYYWKCDYLHVLGTIKGDQLIPAQGYVFCEELESEQPERIGLIYMPEMTQKEKPQGKARVIRSGEAKTNEPDIDLKEGEIVRFNPAYAQKYEVKGKKIIVLRHSQILATL